MRFYLLLFTFCLANFLHSQSNIKGIVSDSNNIAIPYASIVLLKVKDSVMVEFVLSNDKGEFKFSDVKSNDYLLQITMLGFNNHRQIVNISGNNNDLDLGNIKLTTAEHLMDLIEIKAEHNPMKFNNDTVEYNTAAFKTRPGDVVEDLLKKLPGVEVQRDGSIKAYGENVQNVLVDGKEFFGKDTRIATKNLEADAVDKVQVYDKKSEMAEVTGIEDGRDEMTINLKLKEGKKNGYFGNAGAGIGTNERFKIKSNLNRFNPTTKVSFIGSGNNINDQSFSIEDYIDFMGGLGAFMSGGSGGMRLEINSNDGFPLLGNGALDGIQKSIASGININHDFSSKTELNLSYFYNNMINTLNKNSIIENLIDEGNLLTDEIDNNLSKNSSHAMNFKLKHKLDSFQTLILRLGATLGGNKFYSNRTSNSYQANRQALYNNRNLNIAGSNDKYNGSITYQKKFRKKGRSLVLSGSGNNGNTFNEGYINSLNNFFNGDNYDTLNQYQESNDDNYNYTLRANYSEPLGKRNYLQWNGMTSNQNNRVYTDFFDLLNESESVKNELLSNNFSNNYKVYNSGINYAVNTKKFNLTAGVNLQRSILAGSDKSTDFNNRYFSAVLPSLFSRYEFATAHHLNIDYTTRQQEPSLQQLQPIVNNADPLNIFIGNPKLKPEYIHELNASYLMYDQFTFTSVFGRLGASIEKNKIADNIFIDSLARRTIQPVNISNEKNINGSIEFGTPIKPLKVTTKVRYRNQLTKSQLYINGETDNTTRLNHSLNFTVENRNKNRVDVLAGYKWSSNNTTHSLDNNWNQKFNEHNLFAGVNITLSDNWDFSTEIDHRSFDQTDLQSDIPTITLWEAGISTYFMQNKKLKVTLSVFDILNNNNGIRRSSNINYYRVDQTNVLGRYFMLNFNYSIRGFAKKEGGLEIKFEG